MRGLLGVLLRLPSPQHPECIQPLLVPASPLLTSLFFSYSSRVFTASVSKMCSVMLRLSFCSSAALLCLWNNPASLPSWDRPCKPLALALQDNSSLHFSRHHSNGPRQEKTQQMDAGKCYPPLPLALTKTALWSPPNGWTLRDWTAMGCHEHEIKKKPSVSKKREQKPAFKPSSCLETAEQRGQGHRSFPERRRIGLREAAGQ